MINADQVTKVCSDIEANVPKMVEVSQEAINFLS